MSMWMVVAVTMAYLYTAVEQYFLGNNNTAIMFTGYAIANIGIINVLS